jgi:hypothetical protein
MIILLINYIYIHNIYIINQFHANNANIYIYTQPIKVRDIREIVEKDEEKSNNQKLN